MLSKIQLFWGLVIIVFILVVLGVFIYFFDGVDSTVKASLISAIGVVAAIICAHYLTKEREREARSYADMRKSYEEFVLLAMDTRDFLHQRTPDEIQYYQQEMMKFRAGLVIWASAETIKAYAAMRENAEKKNIEILKEIDRLLKSIRKDLGHKDKNLEAEQIISLFATPEEWELIKKK